MKPPYITSNQALENAIPETISHKNLGQKRFLHFNILETHRDLILFPWKVLLDTTHQKENHPILTSAELLHFSEKAQKENSQRMRPQVMDTARKNIILIFINQTSTVFSSTAKYLSSIYSKKFSRFGSRLTHGF